MSGKTLKDYMGDWRRLLDRVEYETSTSGNNLQIKVKQVTDIMK